MIAHPRVQHPLPQGGRPITSQAVSLHTRLVTFPSNPMESASSSVVKISMGFGAGISRLVR